MRYWLVTYSTGARFMTYASELHEAEQLAFDNPKMALGPTFTVKPLPYPCSGVPTLGKPDGCPAFCYRPGRCAGMSSCPMSPACSE